MSVPAAQNDAEAQIVAQIQTLLKELSKCAPHPDKPDHKGPLHLNKSADLRTPDEHDSMLGTLAAESAVGSAFSAVAGEATSKSFDIVWNATEYSSHMYSDRSSRSFSLGQRNMIANDFNGNASKGHAYEAMMKSYLADLPARLNIEKHLAHEVRRLYALRKHAYAFTLAA